MNSFRYHRHSCLVASIALVCFATAVRATEPLPQAHAHNDYEHSRPLLEALSHGFCSVEADVFAVDGELLVAHNAEDVMPDRTLQRLYLDPLRQRVRENGGHVHRNGPGFMLLIDFKSPADSTYAVLKRVLADYRDLLESKSEDQVSGVNQPPVAIVISGNRPFELIQADDGRLCGIDGRISDLNSNLSAQLLPLISDNWGVHFDWNGSGDIPASDRVKLQAIVSQAHAQGRRVRFWATPENEEVWQVLFDAGVDHINTDQLARLEVFLRTQRHGRDK